MVEREWGTKWITERNRENWEKERKLEQRETKRGEKEHKLRLDKHK